LASIEFALANDKERYFSDSSCIDENYSLIAEQISLYSKKNKYSTNVINLTGRHKANQFKMKSHSLAQITQPRQETINSIQKKLKEKLQKERI